MQISEISAAALGGLRGLGLAQGDIEARAIDAGVELTEAISPNKLAPAFEASTSSGSGSTNFDLTPPMMGPSITSAASATGLTGRTLTLALSPKVIEAVKKPAAAVALARKVKASRGKVKVTPKAAKALVTAAKKASPAVAAAVAQAVAPAVVAPTPAAAAVEAKVEAQRGTLVENPLKRLIRSPWVWAGAGVLVLGVAFLFLRSRRATVAVSPVQTQGLGRTKGAARKITRNAHAIS